MTRHAGGCHCGKVRFEAEMELDGLIACNCSICSKKGLILGFIPIDQFTLLSGEADTREYRFGGHNIGHRFCTTCGVQPYASGVGPGGAIMAAVNVRCIDGVDLDTLHPKPFDGASL